ncbi:MAG: beta-ketoacyl-ACP synthase [Myxococcales bacterium]|nr:beta-ketoacyl-ACP synthase [Myxococcales bacterium]
MTGVGLASPIGCDVTSAIAALRANANGVTRTDRYAAYGGLDAQLVAEVRDLDLQRWPRKRVRTMGRVARLALHASEQAIAQANVDEETLRSGRCGIAFGSTHGSSDAWERMARAWLLDNDLRGGGSSIYLQFMAHTCAANLAIYFGITGRVLPTCAACASGSMAIGQAYEAIRAGAQDVMLAGGAEELHPTHVAVFDGMYAASLAHEHPERASRPFDVGRDGLVVGEGAGCVVLERWDRAVARGADILAEVVGYGSSCDGTHVTAPSADGMAAAMRLALESAALPPSAVSYVNAHATATTLGDVVESQATYAVLGGSVPVSSTKGHTGHTLGACGAIETVFCVGAIREGFLPATRNLDQVDTACAPLDYIRTPRDARPAVVMNNNFAFGGINTSLLLRTP